MAYCFPSSALLGFVFCTVHSPNVALVLGILNNSSQKSLHLVAILLLILSLVASVLSSVFTFYNSISNPYQTFLGPMGVYTWNGLSGEFPEKPHEHICAYPYICIHTYTCTHRCTHTLTYTHEHACTQMHAHVYVGVHTCTLIRAHEHTCVYMCSLTCLS